MNLSDYIIWRNSRDLGYNECFNRTPKMFYALGLGGEVGEVENIIKKFIRDNLREDDIRDKIIDEMGDVIWYYIGVLNCFDINIEEVLENNRNKLVARNGTNKIQ